MPEGLAVALAAPGLPLLALTALVAGAVYGFAGFGSALIFIPVAAALFSPEGAALLMALFGLSSTLTVLPRAWREAERRPTLVMLGAAVLALPLGTWALATVPEAPLRWAICGLVAATLAALAMGWRYEVEPGSGARVAVGAASGVIGGATGLGGPLVILFELGGSNGAARARANAIVFLTLLSAALAPALALRGLISAPALWLGAVVVPLHMIGTRLGQAAFRPAFEALYRRVAYAVIALAVLAGLPVWR